MKTEIISIGLLLSLLIAFNIYVTPDIEVEKIDGISIVVSVDGKSTYRPLTPTDEIEGNIIYVGK